MYDVAHVTHRYRARCEDRVDAIEHTQGLVLVVADGAGGSGGGAEAADSLLLWVRAHVTRAADITSENQWCDLLSKVDKQISIANGETTGVVVAVSETNIVGASVGDSAAWLIGMDGFDNLTADQLHKPLIGSGRAKPTSFVRNALGDQVLLLGSDGLVKYAPPLRICEIARQHDLQAAADKMVDLVRLRSGELQDDVAIILCRRRIRLQQNEFHHERKRYTLSDIGEMREEPVD